MCCLIIRNAGETAMKATWWAGLAIATAILVLEIVFGALEALAPFWAFPLFCYGLMLMMTSGLFMSWKKWQLGRNKSTRIKGIRTSTVKESVCVLLIALALTIVFWSFYG
jgi:hypothetical protein